MNNLFIERRCNMLDQKKPANKKRKIIIAVVFVILLVALGICIALLLRPKDEGTERRVIDRDNADEVMTEMSDKVDEGMFECKMTTTWTFDDAASVSPNAYVANVETNRYAIYFDVYQDETNELLYSSPILPVGTELQDIKLDKELSAGEYGAVVMYTLIDEAEEEVSTAGFHITIYVTK